MNERSVSFYHFNISVNLEQVCDNLKYMMCWAIWCHLYISKNVKNIHGGVKACNFTKSNTPPWVFFTFFNLYKWYQIAQRISYVSVEFLEDFTGGSISLQQLHCTD